MIIYDIKWETKTAGPSPLEGNRMELFTFGCKRAAEGNPCAGCFNSALWDSSKAEKSYTPQEIADNIKKWAKHKYITIGGGEPTDQMEDLIELCRILKGYGFHIMVYTWRELAQSLPKPMDSFPGPIGIAEARDFAAGLNFEKLLNNIDMLVDGQFKAEECLYDGDKEDGTFNSVGSANQIIWDAKAFRENTDEDCVKGFRLGDLEYLHIKPENDELVYVHKENAEEQKLKVRRK
jgi:organic radical activating enzyme